MDSDWSTSEAELKERFARHLAEPGVSMAQHSRHRRLVLGSAMLSKTTIYLDQKYWIYCRDAMVGRPQKPVHTEIWQRLNALVQSGGVICPVSFPVLAETFKQAEFQRRLDTSLAIDALCRGVAVQPFSWLVCTELMHLWKSHGKPKVKLYPLRQMVWTYAGLVAGEMPLETPAFDQATNCAIQKEMFDTFAQMPFSQIVRAMADSPTPTDDDDPLDVAQLNADVRQHQHEVTSFEAVFLSEVAGFLDVHRPTIESLSLQMYAEETGLPPPAAGSAQANEGGRLMANMIYYLFGLKKWTTQFPTLHIKAGIHAAVRHRRQPFKPGDLWDHLHACPALAYCDAFFTEKNLGNLLVNRPLEYDKAYDCRVLWDDDAILSFLDSLPS